MRIRRKEDLEHPESGNAVQLGVGDPPYSNRQER